MKLFALLTMVATLALAGCSQQPSTEQTPPASTNAPATTNAPAAPAPAK